MLQGVYRECAIVDQANPDVSIGKPMCSPAKTIPRIAYGDPAGISNRFAANLQNSGKKLLVTSLLINSISVKENGNVVYTKVFQDPNQNPPSVGMTNHDIQINMTAVAFSVSNNNGVYSVNIARGSKVK